MKLSSTTRYLYDRAWFFGKRLQYNFYIKNWLIKKKNREVLLQARNEFNNIQSNKNPLISVCIPTYNRAKILIERSIASVLKQTYQNFEIIVVGDHCTDNTAELLAQLKDNRIKFYNLPERSKYPDNPYERWLAQAVPPINKAVELSSGDWVATQDDDDEFTKDHLEVLLNFALQNNFEMVYGMVEMEMKPGKWEKLGSYPLKCGSISRMSALYHARLKFFRNDIESWKYGEPNDWTFWRHMKEAGVKIGFIDKVVGRHYLEHNPKMNLE